MDKGTPTTDPARLIEAAALGIRHAPPRPPLQPYTRGLTRQAMELAYSTWSEYTLTGQLDAITLDLLAEAVDALRSRCALRADEHKVMLSLHLKEGSLNLASFVTPQQDPYAAVTEGREKARQVAEIMKASGMAVKFHNIAIEVRPHQRQLALDDRWLETNDYSVTYDPADETLSTLNVTTKPKKSEAA